ncbi:ROK family protein [Neobacillus dielmonensis]|uniref:ROK family protein n=1 Tax=Neobacillus dielmonensis TaxID=1347369 RepID=UPI0005A8A518|nr:ROK family protein [Neobacillus dielmonensis]
MNNYMVFDVGGSKVKYAVITETGDFVSRGDFPSPLDDFEKFQSEIVAVTLENKQPFSIKGIAFSCPGGVDSETGIIGGASALPYIHGPNFKKIFSEATGLAVEIENDANCAALGEVWKGAAKDNQNVLFVVIGTGIGGAIVKNRTIHKGANLHGGEIGYMVMNVHEQDGRLTTKTWSEVGSTGALVRRVAALKGIHRSELDGQKIFALAEQGDPDCIKVIDEFYLYLAQGIYNSQYVYDPEKIILGGAISVREDLIEQIYKKLDRILAAVGLAKVRPVIEACQFRNDANLLGALFHFLQVRNLK